jgi:hypothetical protein
MDELLLDDARRYATAAGARGGVVHLDIYEGLHHVFQRSTVELASARDALDNAARFIATHWTAALVKSSESDVCRTSYIEDVDAPTDNVGETAG